MITFRAKLLLFVSLIILVVIVTWIYAQRTYSAFNLTNPGDAEVPDVQNPQAGSAVLVSNQTSSPTASLMPTAIVTIPGEAGCTQPFEYWVQNQEKIPPQLLVRVMDGNQTEACVNYAEIEICANLGEASIFPDVLLRQQFLAAIMNYLSGADTGVIGNTINEAYDWLRSHLLVEIIPNEDMQLAQVYAETLQSYNRGELDPGACEILPVAQAETATPSLTMSGPTAVIPPTSTITPTPRRTVVITVPVATDTPDQGPEPTQPPPPTNTVPVPSDTPPLPPTNTQPPPPPPTEFPTPTPVPEDGTPTPVP